MKELADETEEELGKDECEEGVFEEELDEERSKARISSSAAVEPGSSGLQAERSMGRAKRMI